MELSVEYFFLSLLGDVSRLKISFNFFDRIDVTSNSIGMVLVVVQVVQN